MNNKILILFTVWMFHINNSVAQLGCTDPQANNFNSTATINDGSCTYNATTLPYYIKTPLTTPLLDETSGIEKAKNKIWTFNDSGGGNKLYRIDTATGAVVQTITVTNASNVDWEDIAVSTKHIYIGDIGNNNGNRTNLRVYKIPLTKIKDTTTVVTASIINYVYEDQTDFTSKPDNNNYDCEALIFFNDSLHLFSKNWVDKQTKHYVLSAIPGNRVAKIREALNAGFLITGADITAKSVLTLIGYDNTGVAPISMWMCFDFSNGFFFNGNKRKFNIDNALSMGQVEAVQLNDNGSGYISNERFTKFVFNVPPRLYGYSIAAYLPAVFTRNIFPMASPACTITVTPSAGSVYLENTSCLSGRATIQFYNTLGQLILNKPINQNGLLEIPTSDVFLFYAINDGGNVQTGKIILLQ